MDDYRYRGIGRFPYHYGAHTEGFPYHHEYEEVKRYFIYVKVPEDDHSSRNEVIYVSYEDYKNHKIGDIILLDYTLKQFDDESCELKLEGISSQIS